MTMTPDELYAKGYSIEWQTWGCHVFLDTPDHMTELAHFMIQFDRPLNAEEAQRRGWEAACADFVARRLEGRWHS